MTPRARHPRHHNELQAAMANPRTAVSHMAPRRLTAGANLTAAAVLGATAIGGAPAWTWLAATVLLTVGSALLVAGGDRHQPHTRRRTRRAPTRASPGSLPVRRPATGAPRSARPMDPAGPYEDPAAEDARRLVAECEAVLSGRYAEYLEQRGRPVPAGAWANLLAHGTAAELRAAISLPVIGGSAHWKDARSFLADTVLDLVDHDPATLAELQQALLMPLELELASRHTAAPASASEFVFAFLDTLDTRCP